MKAESPVKRSSSSRLENFLTRSSSGRDEEEMRAAGVLSVTEESTLRGIDFCPSVAQSQYTTGTSEMEEYNKAFLEKVAASVRVGSLGRVDKPPIEETAEGLDTTQESSYEVVEEHYKGNNSTAGSRPRATDDAADAGKGNKKSPMKNDSQKKESDAPDIFEEVVKIFEMVVGKLKEALVIGSGKLKECYDSHDGPDRSSSDN